MELEQYSNGGFIIFMADENGSPKMIDMSSTELTKEGLHCIIFQYIQEVLGLDIVSSEDSDLTEEEDEGSDLDNGNNEELE